MITVRYFAAAKAAAGLDEERIDTAACLPLEPERSLAE